MTQLIGLDIETTGSNINDGHVIIQIGVTFEPDQPYTFVSDIGWEPGSYTWQQAALDVNGFTHERIADGPTPSYVDQELRRFLDQHSKGRLVPVGWNVGSFDVPFVQKFLPKTAQRLSYRALDLNSVCFYLEARTAIDYQAFKDEAKQFARQHLGCDNSHDALFDARAAVRELEQLLAP